MRGGAPWSTDAYLHNCVATATKVASPPLDCGMVYKNKEAFDFKVVKFFIKFLNRFRNDTKSIPCNY